MIQKIKPGDFAILIDDMNEFVCEGIITVYCPDGEPLVVVDGKGYDLTTEGGTIEVILKTKKS